MKKAKKKNNPKILKEARKELHTRRKNIYNDLDGYIVERRKFDGTKTFFDRFMRRFWRQKPKKLPLDVYQETDLIEDQIKYQEIKSPAKVNKFFSFIYRLFVKEEYKLEEEIIIEELEKEKPKRKQISKSKRKIVKKAAKKKVVKKKVAKKKSRAKPKRRRK